MFKEKTVAVGPAGQWGSAFALVLARSGHHVRLFLNDPGDVRYFQDYHRTKGLDAEMPSNVIAFSDIKQWIDGAELVVVSPSSSGFRPFIRKINPSIPSKTDRLILSKGLEQETCKRMSEIMLEEDPTRIDHVAVLSGPNLAEEVARGELAGAVVASYNPGVADRIRKIVNSDSFNVYTSDDVAGVEYGAAFKNVTALGAGMADAFEVSSSTKSFYLTRSLEEMAALGKALGAHDSTFRGLAGYGDLSLSCYKGRDGQTTRNYRAGFRLAQGWSVEKVLSEELVEGYYTLKSAMELAQLHKIPSPIIAALYGIWYKGVTIRGDINQLMGIQPVKEQFGDKGIRFRLSRFLTRVFHNTGISSSF